jgi:glycosyltransferase involved in cell wall biosynthesis
LQSPKTSYGSNEDTEVTEVELKVVIGIPAYNSERALGKTVTPLKGVVDEIIVCDNGSTDSTSNTAESLGCKVVTLTRRYDDSSALLALFGAALETEADVLITLPPGSLVNTRDIETLATRIALQHADIVFGTNQGNAKSDAENSPIKAYSRKAFSKMFFSHSTKLGTGNGLGLEISNYPIKYGAKGSATSQSRSVSSPSQQGGMLETSSSNRKSGLNKIFRVGGQPVSMGFLFKNIWFLRTLLIVSGIIVSGLLLAYSIIFWNTFQSLGNTTSYFPWSWGLLYTNPATVMNLFAIGLGASIGPLVLFVILFLKWVLPELQISFTLFKRRTKVSAQKTA